MSRADLDTPCLLVDLDRVEVNLARMAELTGSRGVRLRPHVKTHKSVRLARRQLELGAAGITCATVSEAAVMVAGGVDDVFVASSVVGAAKVSRLVALARAARIRVGVDSIHVARPIADAAHAAAVQLGVMLEIDVGVGRGGIPAAGAVDLARQLRELPGLRVDGVFGFAGYGGPPDPAERERAARREGDLVLGVADRLRGLGLDCAEVSLGSTPLAEQHSTIEGVTEIRPGTYVFGDVACLERQVMADADIAATVAARVVGRPDYGIALIDAGTKALSHQQWAGAPCDAGWARVAGHPDARVLRTWEEHGVLALDDSLRDLRVGDLVELVPNHVCPVVDLYDQAVLVRDGEPVTTLPIDARGCSQ